MKQVPQVREFNPVDGQFFLVNDKSGDLFAKAWRKDHAALLAAAPELLKACRLLAFHDCESYGCDMDDPNHVCAPAIARAAIRKATGEIA